MKYNKKIKIGNKKYPLKPFSLEETGIKLFLKVVGIFIAWFAIILLVAKILVLLDIT